MHEITNSEAAEIQASYRTAKNQTNQISILAQLYDISENVVRQVLGLEPADDEPAKAVVGRKSVAPDEAVQAVICGGLSVAQAAAQFDIPYATLYSRVAKGRRATGQAASATKPERLAGPSKPQPAKPVGPATPKPPPSAGEAARVADTVLQAQTSFIEARNCLLEYLPATTEERHVMETYLHRAAGFIEGLDYIRQMKGDSHAQDKA